MGGLFITMEGTDGSGKTTQIELLSKYLKGIGKEVVITREPGGTAISEQIRNIILDVNNTKIAHITEAFLYASARAQLVQEIIKPALAEGKTVISDRFVDSSLVYQGIARGLGIQRVMEINEYATENILPDITIFLDLSPQEGIKRKKFQASLDRIENEKNEFHQMVYDGYKQIARTYSERIKTIDATKSVEEVQKQIYNVLKDYFEI